MRNPFMVTLNELNKMHISGMMDSLYDSDSEATQVYDPHANVSHHEIDMDVDSADDNMNTQRKSYDTVLQRAIEISEEYPDHLFIDVEYLFGTGAEDGSHMQLLKIANISAIGNGSLTEFNFWDCLAWQDLNADELEHEVCAFIHATLPWFQANRIKGDIVKKNGRWNQEDWKQEWMGGIIRLKDDVDDEYEIVDCEQTFKPSSLWTRKVIQFRDLVNQYENVVAFGNPHAHVDNVQIKKAWDSLDSIFVEGFWKDLTSKMRNPNTEWKTTLENRCQTRMKELSKMAVITDQLKTVPGHAIQRLIMEGQNGLLQEYNNRDTALLVLLTHDAVLVLNDHTFTS